MFFANSSKDRILILLILLATITPYPIWVLFSLQNKYHQVQEVERLINQAYLVEENKIDSDWYDLESFTKLESKIIIQTTLSKMQHITNNDPLDIELQLLLGRIALLAGKPQDAIRAFSHAIRLRSDSPSIWFELGNAYASLAPPRSHTDSSNPFSLQPSWQWLSTSPTKYYWLLLNEPENIPQWWDPARPVKRTVVQSDELHLRVSIPATPTELIFWMASSQIALEDTITYQIQINDDVQTTYTFTSPTPSRWRLARVDLSRWASQTITVTLKASHPQAGWGDIMVARVDEADCIVVDCLQRAVAAWREGGFTVGDMIRAGETSFDMQQYDKAFKWYERALLFNEHQSDILYNLGRLFEANHQLSRALDAYNQAITVNQFNLYSISNVYFRIGEFYQSLLDPPNYDTAIWAYNQALVYNHFRTDQERSQCYYRIGEILWRQRKIEQAILYLEKAITLSPNYYLAYLRLGASYYALNRDVQQAERILLQAIALEPQNKWAYFNLGEIYQDAGFLQQAMAMYRKTLEIDSQFTPAIEKLRSLEIP